MNKVKLLIIFIVTSWLLGFLYFIKITQNTTNTDRSITDAIIVFGQKKQYLYAATELLKLGYAPLIFITGNGNRTEFRNYFQTHKLAGEQFIFKEEVAGSNDNYVNSLIVFLNKYNLHSVRIVVDSYELPRLMIEIGSLLPRDLTVISHPVVLPGKQYGLIFKEYIKYWLMLLASFVGHENELNLSYS